MPKRTRIPSMTSGQIAKTFDGEDKAFRCEPFKLKRTKKVKAVAEDYYGVGYWDEKDCVYRIPRTPVWFVHRTAEAYDAMVEQMARAIHGGTWTYDVGEDHTREGYRDDAKAALRAIGITRDKEGK